MANCNNGKYLNNSVELLTEELVTQSIRMFTGSHETMRRSK
jgi:hypothetical protein